MGTLIPMLVTSSCRPASASCLHVPHSQMSGLAFLKYSLVSQTLVVTSSYPSGPRVLPRSTVGVIRGLALLLAPWVMVRGCSKALEKTRGKLKPNLGSWLVSVHLGSQSVVLVVEDGCWPLPRGWGSCKNSAGPLHVALTPRDGKHQEVVVGGSVRILQGFISGTPRKGSEGDLGQALGSLRRVLGA